MIMDCDFCVFNEATSVFVISMGILPSIRTDPAQPVELDDGRWNSCEGCEPLVEQRAKAKLVARVVSVFRKSGMLPSPTPGELAAIKFNLDRKYTALFDADPVKRPI
ncbi:hypothetical protein ACIOGZ_08180 [Kitasatospora sp. NPDC088160]|uniref:hypothetical protein n=1 Tax=Kitasatospora sp. NPDC088160 TaxID=3364072 RepID=UPI0038053349